MLKYNNTEFHKGDSLFSRDMVYRMAGNSIPVQLLEGAFLQIVRIDNIIQEDPLLRNRAELRNSSLREHVSLLKKKLNKQGLREREATFSYPENAQILYPRYKSALYIEDCYNHGHSCVREGLSDLTKDHWDMVFALKHAKESEKFREATELGWNAIVIYSCFTERADEKYFNRVAEAIKANEGSKAERGTVIEIE